MTNLPSGNTRTSPIAGSLDGFDTDLRTALARLDRERRSSFARPGQRAEALERFTDAVTKALGKVRGHDRVAALAAQKDALDQAAVSTAKTITALERQLAKTVAEAAELREALAGAAGERSKLRLDLAVADKRLVEQKTELTETRASLAAALAMGRDSGPGGGGGGDWDPPLEAPAPPLPRRNGPGKAPGATQTGQDAKSSTGGPSTRSKPAAKRTEPQA